MNISGESLYYYLHPFYYSLFEMFCVFIFLFFFVSIFLFHYLPVSLSLSLSLYLLLSISFSSSSSSHDMTLDGHLQSHSSHSHSHSRKLILRVSIQVKWTVFNMISQSPFLASELNDKYHGLYCIWMWINLRQIKVLW